MQKKCHIHFSGAYAYVIHVTECKENVTFAF